MHVSITTYICIYTHTYLNIYLLIVCACQQETFKQVREQKIESAIFMWQYAKNFFK